MTSQVCYKVQCSYIRSYIYKVYICVITQLLCLTVPVVYLERASYTVLEEDLQLELSVVRDGNFSTESNVLFTTEDDTALGI